MKIHHCQGLVSTEARAVSLNLQDGSTTIEEENWRIWIMTTVRFGEEGEEEENINNCSETKKKC